jgi:DNA-binding transcriptional regulator YiaG
VTPNRIKALRKRLGLTQQQLADMIAATQVTVARWETGSNEPKGAYVKALQELANKAKTKPKRRKDEPKI